MNLKNLMVALTVASLAACSTKEQHSANIATSVPAAEVPPAAGPSGPAADSVDYFNTVVGNAIYFSYDQFQLTDAARMTLQGQARWLSQNPSRTLIIEGHCDERGTREYNLGLGERRAHAVRAYLVSQGIADSRLRTLSYGKERPVCDSSSEDCWSQNRRGLSVVQ
jgi:peptidoglycan-associated lipoprotein